MSGATATLRRLHPSPHLGVLVVPAAGNWLDPVFDAGVPGAADNATFSKFDPVAFCRVLGRIGGRPGCRFVALPDVVGDAEPFATWPPVLTALGLPAALVLQDGQERVGVPWGAVDAVFVGGSTGFKLGPVAAALVREAKRRGKWAHLGRFNTRGRFRHVHALGCDNVDGSRFSQCPDRRLPMALRWRAAAGHAGGDLTAPPRAQSSLRRPGRRVSIGRDGRTVWRNRTDLRKQVLYTGVSPRASRGKGFAGKPAGRVGDSPPTAGLSECGESDD